MKKKKKEKKKEKIRKKRCRHLSGHLQIDETFSDFYEVNNGILNKGRIAEKEFIIKGRQFVCNCGHIIKDLKDEKLKKLIDQT